MPKRAVARLRPAVHGLAVAAGLGLAVPPAHAACYADRDGLRSAVRTIVASFRCPVFKEAIYGDRATRFLSDAGVIDQSTGSCRDEISAAMEAMSIEALSGEAGFCAKAAAVLEAEPGLREAARKANAL